MQGVPRVSSAYDATNRPHAQPLSPAARWVAAAVLGGAGVLGVARGLSNSSSVPIESGSMTTALGHRTAAADATAGTDGAGITAPAKPPTAQGVARKINLNTASAAELDLLPSIGPTLAARIIADREANGPFSSLDDLDRVPGIGPKTIAKLVPYASAE